MPCCRDCGTGFEGHYKRFFCTPCGKVHRKATRAAWARRQTAREFAGRRIKGNVAEREYSHVDALRDFDMAVRACA